ncbi:hypothetical protein SteCoe_15810 [Stentor coeruleus]|uniref:Uncharacterized protein n=1 Tax=Stentor coeruleus TaxID=5963 RepID=A0A1R2C2R3_9CILI|nr:hypothetical protein SteCoe_15810 [Stentor coeruleus]
MFLDSSNQEKNPFAIEEKPIISYQGKGFALNIHEVLNSSSSSSDSSNSCDSPLSPELQKIKTITQTFTTQVTEKLIKYKNLRKAYDHQAELLKHQVQTFQEESKSLKSLNDLRQDADSINEKVRTIRKYMSLKNSRLPTDENQLENSLNQNSLSEVLHSIQNEIEDLKIKYEKVEINPFLQENLSANLIIGDKNQHDHLALESEEPKVVCNCILM